MAEAARALQAGAALDAVVEDARVRSERCRCAAGWSSRRADGGDAERAGDVDGAGVVAGESRSSSDSSAIIWPTLVSPAAISAPCGWRSRSCSQRGRSAGVPTRTHSAPWRSASRSTSAVQRAAGHSFAGPYAAAGARASSGPRRRRRAASHASMPARCRGSTSIAESAGSPAMPSVVAQQVQVVVHLMLLQEQRVAATVLRVSSGRAPIGGEADALRHAGQRRPEGRFEAARKEDGEVEAAASGSRRRRGVDPPGRRASGGRDTRSLRRSNARRRRSWRARALPAPRGGAREGAPQGAERRQGHHEIAEPVDLFDEDARRRRRQRRQAGRAGRGPGHGSTR